MDQELIKSLSLLGLKEKEAKIYLTLYKLGKSKAGNIVKETSIPRATVYQILDKLVQKGYIMVIDSDNILSYFAEEPEKILNKLKEEEENLLRKKKIFSSLLPKITKLKNPYYKEPKVIYFEGIDSYIELLEDVLSSGEKEIFMLSNNQIKSNHIADEIKNIELYNYEFGDFLNERLKRGIKMNLITTRLDFGEELIRTDSQNIRETKLLSDDFGDVETIIIYGDKIILLNDNSPIIGIFIEDFQMKNMFSNIFHFIWNKI